MTTLRRARTVHVTTAVAAIVINAGAIGFALARHQWTLAAVQSLALLVSAGALWAGAHVEQWVARKHSLLDTQIAEGVAKQKFAEAMLRELERHQQQGGAVEFSVRSVN